MSFTEASRLWLSGRGLIIWYSDKYSPAFSSDIFIAAQTDAIFSFSIAYKTNLSTLEKLTDELRAELGAFDTDSVSADKFMELAQRYTDFTELTLAMLHEFVEKVVVHEADKSSSVREQRVDIYLNYIGQLDVPDWFEVEGEVLVVMLTADEKKRARWREYARKARAKKLAAKMQEQYISA